MTQGDLSEPTKRRWLPWVKTAVRWSIAIVGVWWIVAQLSLHDSVLVVPEDGALPRRMTIARLSPLAVQDGKGGTLDVTRDQTVSKPDGNGKTVSLRENPDRKLPLIGLDLDGEANRSPTVRRVLVNDDGRSRFVRPGELAQPFVLRVPNPRIDTGIVTMVRRANHWLLLAALAVFPITYLVTTWRWQKLLAGLDIPITFRRALQLNMAGAFYNSFLPGSTGGDVIKAIYASRQTPHKAAAVMSVLIDRILGLLVLVALGGSMALYQYALSSDKLDPTAHACRNVAIAAAVILLGTVFGVLFLGLPKLRRATGLNYLGKRLPGQSMLVKVVDVLRLYRKQPGLIVWALVVTLPVHLTVVVSALLAGKAFDLPISAPYYFVVVPVSVLVGSIPISPQGAGVMEYFANLLMARQGATLSHAVALTMSIRLVQVLWNLTGAIFVLRGHFHAPTDAELSEVEHAREEPVDDAVPVPSPATAGEG